MVCQRWADLHIHYWFVSNIKCFKKKLIFASTLPLVNFRTIFTGFGKATIKFQIDPTLTWMSTDALALFEPTSCRASVW